ncbi:MAG: filamentous hemagglutinin N-terminal domain-containing protein, partial [Proteobacteria bacterium]|nr:filamentous hemagglutinin N-terminal domain-containing protein [Pseudomonadota bacterium]
MLRTRPVISTALSLALGALLVAPPAGAGPTGERVVNGDVSITRKGSKTRIVASDKSIIHWVTFDIARGEKVRFVQPSHDSTVLNRVLYASPTQIDGILRANGRVYIVNPSGIYFCGEAVVDVGRLVAVAGNLGDHDFVAGIDRFRDLSGEVENAGLLRGNEIALVGRRVANHGRIESRNGSLLMIAGDEVWLGRHGSNVLVQIGVLANPDGGAGPAVENTGVLDAGRGRVRMAAGDTLGLAVRNHGAIRARRIALEGGRVEVGGSLDASNARAGRKGGVIAIRGDEIAVDRALLDASGDRGGGKIAIGGKVRGGGRHTARETVVGPDAELRADARERGDGGTVIVWADGNARIDGVISARGGSEGGDGGFVETSGKRHLAVSRAPDVTAPAGDGGTWLLDPANVTIVEEISDALQGTERDLDEVADSPLGTPGPGDPRVVQPVAGSSEVTAGVIVDALS